MESLRKFIEGALGYEDPKDLWEDELAEEIAKYQVGLRYPLSVQERVGDVLSSMSVQGLSEGELRKCLTAILMSEATQKALQAYAKEIGVSADLSLARQMECALDQALQVLIDCFDPFSATSLPFDEEGYKNLESLDDFIAWVKRMQARKYFLMHINDFLPESLIKWNQMGQAKKKRIHKCQAELKKAVGFMFEDIEGLKRHQIEFREREEALIKEAKSRCYYSKELKAGGHVNSAYRPFWRRVLDFYIADFLSSGSNFIDLLKETHHPQMMMHSFEDILSGPDRTFCYYYENSFSVYERAEHLKRIEAAIHPEDAVSLEFFNKELGPYLARWGWDGI